MSQAEELLENLTEEKMYTASPETEEHIFISSDRHITVPDKLKRIAVQYDHNIETVTFDCPRCWDGVDMSTMMIYINYMRPDGTYGSYLVSDATVDENDDSVMHFNWTISNHVSEIKGNISFLICIKKADDEGNEEIHWNTELNSEMYISAGLECVEAIQKSYPDIFAQLLGRMESNEETSSQYVSAAETSANMAKSYAVGTDGTVRTEDATDNAKYYAASAKTSAESAASSETNAKLYMETANQSKLNAAASEVNSKSYMEAAQSSAESAGSSEQNAGTYETTTKQYMEAAQTSAESAASSAGTAEGLVQEVREIVENSGLAYSDGSNAKGVWDIDISGNAGTATKLQTPVNINGVEFDGSSDITLTPSDVGADASGSADAALTEAKSYTDTKVADLVGSAPETLDTLEELSGALKDNADIVDVLNESIANKADSGHTHANLTIQANGTSLGTYNGSTAKTFNITPSGIGAATSGHTHNYAGSSSAGGSANSAVKLDSSAGSATQPVYFSGGKPVATTYTLAKSVPADAKFTDTTYTSLKNPNALTVKANGTSLGTYDGSAAKTFNITASGVGAAASSHSHSDYATKASPTFTGSISHGRKSGSTNGTGSVVLGSVNGIASGYYSAALGGSGNNVGAWGSLILGGYDHSVDADDAAIIGGYSNSISGSESVVLGGAYNTALRHQTVAGHGNNTGTAGANSYEGTSTGSAFVIGNGTSTSPSNAFRVRGDGKVYAAQTSMNTGADYAEYFEWSDGNLKSEDRVGYFVTFDDGNLIRKANSKDEYILGIISGNPSVVGNADECWVGRFVRDDFGRYIDEEFEYEVVVGYEEVEEPEESITEPEEPKKDKPKKDKPNKKIKKIKKKETGTKWKENPNYDQTQTYVPRDQRAEWSAVGMLGVLSVYDDGTCVKNGYCTVKDGGIATACKYGKSDNCYRVLERVTDNIVKVVFRH